MAPAIDGVQRRRLCGQLFCTGGTTPRQGRRVAQGCRLLLFVVDVDEVADEDFLKAAKAASDAGQTEALEFCTMWTSMAARPASPTPSISTTIPAHPDGWRTPASATSGALVVRGSDHSSAHAVLACDSSGA